MKKVTIIANDKNGVELGRREEELAETLDELTGLAEDSDIVKLYNKAYVIDVQRELRGPKAESDFVKAFKKLSPAEQAKALEKMSA